MTYENRHTVTIETIQGNCVVNPVPGAPSRLTVSSASRESKAAALKEIDALLQRLHTALDAER